MYDLKKRADSDTSRLKADLGVGIYRNEAGVYQELDVVKQVSLARAKTLRLRTVLNLNVNAEFTIAGKERTGRSQPRPRCMLHHLCLLERECPSNDKNSMSSLQEIEGFWTRHLG